MAIILVPQPGSTPSDLTDWTKSVESLKQYNLGVNKPVDYDFSGNTIKKGVLITIGGSNYYCNADTAISGTASDYVKITSAGVASYVSSLSGVSWNDTYNFYADSSGNAYIFNEAKAGLANTAIGAFAKEAYFNGKATLKDTLDVLGVIQGRTSLQIIDETHTVNAAIDLIRGSDGYGLDAYYDYRLQNNAGIFDIKRKNTTLGEISLFSISETTINTPLKITASDLINVLGGSSDSVGEGAYFGVSNNLETSRVLDQLNAFGGKSTWILDDETWIKAMSINPDIIATKVALSAEKDISCLTSIKVTRNGSDTIGGGAYFQLKDVADENKTVVTQLSLAGYYDTWIKSGTTWSLGSRMGNTGDVEFYKNLKVDGAINPSATTTIGAGVTITAAGSASFSGAISAGSASITGALTAGSASFSGAINPTSTPALGSSDGLVDGGTFTFPNGFYNILLRMEATSGSGSYMYLERLANGDWRRIVRYEGNLNLYQIMLGSTHSSSGSDLRVRFSGTGTGRIYYYKT